MVIPTYNRVHLLLTALSSVIAQSYPPQEIIIVDDHSTDETVETVGHIARSMEGDKRIQIQLVRLAQHSGRPGEVRNRGVGGARGEYIAFLDDDDQWMPQKLERQMALHLAHRECAISCTAEYWVRRGRLIPHPTDLKTELTFTDALQKCIIGPSTAIVRRECIDPHHSAGISFNPTLEIAEDYHLWLRLLDRYRAARYIAEQMTIKCEHGHACLSARHPYVERFRITALGLLLEQGRLSAPHHQQAAAVYAQKCRIWAAGAGKRGRIAEAEEYERLAQRVR